MLIKRFTLTAALCVLIQTSALAVTLEPWSPDSPRPSFCQIEVYYGGMWATPRARELKRKVLESIAGSKTIARATTLKAGREGETFYCLFIGSETDLNSTFDDLVRLLPTASELAIEANVPGLAPLSIWKRGPSFTTQP